jgi:hypothetical protein
VIVTITIDPCPRCGSKDIVKNGTDYKDDQKYHCHTCSAYGTPDRVIITDRLERQMRRQHVH